MAIRKQKCWWCRRQSQCRWRTNCRKSCWFNDSDYVVNSIWHFGVKIIISITTKIMAPWGRMKDLVGVFQDGDQHCFCILIYAGWHMYIGSVWHNVMTHLTIERNKYDTPSDSWCDKCQSRKNDCVSILTSKAKQLWGWAELESALRRVTFVQHCSEA